MRPSPEGKLDKWLAAGDGRPECIVSGGLGTMKVTHNGKDYYVCCCRDAFKEPEKYLREFQEKRQ